MSPLPWNRKSWSHGQSTWCPGCRGTHPCPTHAHWCWWRKIWTQLFSWLSQREDVEPRLHKTPVGSTLLIVLLHSFPCGTFWWVWIRRPELSWLIKAWAWTLFCFLFVMIWEEEDPLITGIGRTWGRERHRIYPELGCLRHPSLGLPWSRVFVRFFQRRFWLQLVKSTVSFHCDCLYPHVERCWHSQRHFWDQSGEAELGYILYGLNKIYLCDFTVTSIYTCIW